MKELYILDEPETKGYAYTSHGTAIRGLDGKWRRSTRREWFMFQMNQPRLSIAGFIYGLIVYAGIVLVAEWLT